MTETQEQPEPPATPTVPMPPKMTIRVKKAHKPDGTCRGCGALIEINALDCMTPGCPFAMGGPGRGEGVAGR